MLNALIELDRFLSGHSLTFDDIVCAYVYQKQDPFKYKGSYNTMIKLQTYSLKVNYTQKELREFIDVMNLINYDNSYGLQQLYGMIWLTNNRWLEREEYDGSEWWELKEYPVIPEELLN